MNSWVYTTAYYFNFDFIISLRYHLWYDLTFYHCMQEQFRKYSRYLKILRSMHTALLMFMTFCPQLCERVQSTQSREELTSTLLIPLKTSEISASCKTF